MDDFFTTKEIAKMLRVNVVTVRRWITSGKIGAAFLGKDYRIADKDFLKFLSDRRVKKLRRTKKFIR